MLVAKTEDTHGGPLAPLAEHKTALLTTFKRDGTGVDTPVTVVVDGDHAFFRTFDQSWKAKRLRNNPAVKIAPSTASGKALGPAIDGVTRLLDDEEAKRPRKLLAGRAPLLQRYLVPWFHRIRGFRTLHYELVPTGAGSPDLD